MSKESTVFMLGVIVAAAPLAGIPDDWKRWVLIVAGVLIAIFGYQLRHKAFLRSIETTHGERHSDAFVESGAIEESPDFLTETDDRIGV